MFFAHLGSLGAPQKGRGREIFDFFFNIYMVETNKFSLSGGYHGIL